MSGFWIDPSIIPSIPDEEIYEEDEEIEIEEEEDI